MISLSATTPWRGRTLGWDATGRYTAAYDALGRLSLAVKPSANRITYAYDAVGNRKTMTEPAGGRFSYVYGPRNEIASLSNPNGERTTFVADAVGRRTVEYLANGTRASYAYDAGSRLTRLANIKSDGTTISSYGYKHDAVGNRTAVLEASGARVTWRYDKTYQLTNEKRSGTNVYNTTYAYDNAGNRSSKRTASGSANLIDYAYDAANQMTSITDPNAIGPVFYGYDAAGNQTTVSVADDQSTTVTTYVWDYENRMTGGLTGASRATYAYDPDGHRVKAEAGASTTGYVWDQENILREEDGSGTLLQLSTLEPRLYGNLISQRSPSVSRFYHFDGLGSTNQITDAGAFAQYQYLYKAFGEQLVATGLSTSNAFRYVGRLGYAFDNASGLAVPLYQVRARWYNPAIGRWVSAEPLDDFRRQGNQEFAHTNSSPMNSFDPSGERPISIKLPILDVDSIVKACSEIQSSLVGCTPIRVHIRLLDFDGFTVICKNGKPQILPNMSPEKLIKFDKCGITPCIILHEFNHYFQLTCLLGADPCTCNLPTPVVPPNAILGFGFREKPCSEKSECIAIRKEFDCLKKQYEKVLTQRDTDKNCKDEICKMIKDAGKRWSRYKCVQYGFGSLSFPASCTPDQK